MIYQVIGTMSGSSMDGLDIAHCTFEEVAGKWSYVINHATCIPFTEEWLDKLGRVTQMGGKELLLTHTAFGQWMGQEILKFIHTHQLDHRVHLIASHGHTVFHEPKQGMTFQMGDGASIAAVVKLPVITDLRNLDVALGGQGAPIVPIGEKLLWEPIRYFLNIGGICNITKKQDEQVIAFDVCPANRVLNTLAQTKGQAYDNKGELSAKGSIHQELLDALNEQSYYQLSPPKSLANEFGAEVLMKIIDGYSISIEDKLRTMVEHIAIQVANVLDNDGVSEEQLLVTGGGALNDFLIKTLQEKLTTKQIKVIVPDEDLIGYKEAVVMALIGILRWREEANVLSSVTGARESSIGGALWMGYA